MHWYFLHLSFSFFEKNDHLFLHIRGEKEKDACEGDGGGPLVCPKRDDSTRLVFNFVIRFVILTQKSILFD